VRLGRLLSLTALAGLLGVSLGPTGTRGQTIEDLQRRILEIERSTREQVETLKRLIQQREAEMAQERRAQEERERALQSLKEQVERQQASFQSGGVSFGAPAAQAPVPKVTITGLIDVVGTGSRNLNMDATIQNANTTAAVAAAARGAATDDTDKEAYGRIRTRLDIIGELLRAKFVLGLELDTIFGQTGSGDTCSRNIATFAGCRTDGSSGGFDANTDIRDNIEVKWTYLEFPATGRGSLLPFIPWEGTLAVGGQPFALGTTKFSLLADSDFGGVTYRARFSPAVRASLTYAQFEERSTGPFYGFFRGDDWGVIGMATVTPMKGLAVMPIYAFQQIVGSTSLDLRKPVGGYGIGASNFPPGTLAVTVTTTPPGTPVVLPAGNGVTGVACVGSGGTAGSPGAVPVGTAAVAPEPCRGTIENRHTVGFDMRWDTGPFYVSPTFFYQFGQRERYTSPTDPGSGGLITRKTADISAFITDVQAGYRRGPLLLEFRGMYSSGNKAQDNLNDEINYFQGFTNDNAYWIGWGEVSAISFVDYMTIYNGVRSPYSPASNYGYDRYGMFKFAVKATYSLSPALTLYGWVSPQWTAEKVDTDTVLTINGRTRTNGAPQDSTARGDERYFGTELTAGLIWRFAPGLTYDLVGSYFFAGPAQDALSDTGLRKGGAPTGVFRKFDSKDAYIAATRVRFVF
jgi:hypothetical protein